MNKVELQNLVGGALQEKFAKSFEKVIENLQDSNTSFKVKRGITIKLDFLQNEQRDDMTVSIDVTEKLAPQQGMSTKFSMGKDLRTGELYAEEYGKHIKGQMSMDDYSAIQVIGDDVVDTDTGEVINQENETVVDFRKVAAK